MTSGSSALKYDSNDAANIPVRSIAKRGLHEVLLLESWQCFATLFTDSRLVGFHCATSRPFDEKLDGGVTVAQLRLHILREDGPVQLVGAERATDVEGAATAKQRSHELHVAEV